MSSKQRTHVVGVQAEHRVTSDDFVVEPIPSVLPRRRSRDVLDDEPTAGPNASS